MKIAKKHLSSLMLAKLLTGCGGGSSGEENISTPIAAQVTGHVARDVPMTILSNIPGYFEATISNSGSGASIPVGAVAYNNIHVNNITYPMVEGVQFSLTNTNGVGANANCYDPVTQTGAVLQPGESCNIAFNITDTSGLGKNVSGEIVATLDGATNSVIKYLISMTFLPSNTIISATGQTKCYGMDGEIPCADAEDFPRQDGEIKAGQSLDMSSRFTVNNDTTVSDNLTGLMWQQDPSVNNEGNTVDWTTALTTCMELNQGEYSDWRLPNRNELQSIINYGAKPMDILNASGFSNVNKGYWSSTTVMANTNYAWAMGLTDGNTLYGLLEKASNSRVRTWCVRGEAAPDSSSPVLQTGQKLCYGIDGVERSCTDTGEDGEYKTGLQWDIASRFNDNQDGTVTDTLSGLIWQKDPSLNNEGNPLNWQDAIKTCANLSLADKDDWRAPNVFEWMSLLDLSVTNQADQLNLHTPFENIAGGDTDTKGEYWTSTTLANAVRNSKYGWTVRTWDGDLHYADKTSVKITDSNNDTRKFHIMCVRGGL